jgi:hypothetical protein
MHFLHPSLTHLQLLQRPQWPVSQLISWARALLLVASCTQHSLLETGVHQSSPEYPEFIGSGCRSWQSSGMIDWWVQQSDSIDNYIYNASEDYMIDHSLMEWYKNKLQLGNVVVVNCGLERYHKTTWMRLNKVAFKICGISYIGKGSLPLNELSTLGALPSKKKLCKL